MGGTGRTESGTGGKKEGTPRTKAEKTKKEDEER